MRQDDTAKQIQCLCFRVCPQETFILPSEKVKQLFEMHHVGRVQFYWHLSKAVSVIYADSRLVELLRWIVIKGKQPAAGGRHS